MKTKELSHHRVIWEEGFQAGRQGREKGREWEFKDGFLRLCQPNSNIMGYVLTDVLSSIVVQPEDKEDFKRLMKWTEQEFMDKVFVGLRERR